jgi:hypothetical protein
MKEKIRKHIYKSLNGNRIRKRSRNELFYLELHLELFIIIITIAKEKNIKN